MLRPVSTPLRLDRLTAASALRWVANMLIVLLAVVSTVVTARALACTNERPVAARCERATDSVIPPAQNPMTLQSSEPVMAAAVSMASMHAAAYESSDQSRCSGGGLRHDIMNSCKPRDRAYSTKLRPGARSRK